MVWASANWTGLLLLSYIIGSFPTAYMLGRITKGVDIRRLGSGNAGAANAYNQLGPKVGIAVWAVDCGKGAAALAVIGALSGSTVAQMLAGIAVIAGHNWPFFLRFRGGEGASATMGVLAMLMPMAAIPLSVFSLIPLAITRSSTVALCFVFAPLSLVAWLTGASLSMIGYSMGLPVLVGISHWVSMKRPALAEEGETASQSGEAGAP